MPESLLRRGARMYLGYRQGGFVLALLFVVLIVGGAIAVLALLAATPFLFWL